MKGQPVFVACLVGLVVAVTALTMGMCVAQTAQGELAYPPTMTPPVLALYNEGAAAFQKGELQKAQEKYQAALEQARELGDESGIGASLAGLGAVHGGLNEYPKALESFSDALPYLTSINNLVGQWLVLGAIGDVHVKMGNIASAIEAFDRSNAIEKQILAKTSEQEKLSIPLSTFLNGRAYAYFQKAWAHKRLGQSAEALDAYRQAAELYAQALPLLQEEGRVADATWARANLSWSYLEAGKYKEAAEVSADVVKIADRERLPGLIHNGYSVLGRSFEATGKLEEALTHYQSALESFRKFKQKHYPSFEAEFLYLKAEIYRVRSQYEEAIEHFHAAALRYREAKVAKGEATALTRLAETFLWIMDYKAAKKYYKQALELYKAEGDLPKQLEILAALAESSWVGEEEFPGEQNEYLKEAEKLVNLVGLDPGDVLLEVKKEEDKKFDTEYVKLVQKLRKEIPSLSEDQLGGIAYVEYIIRASRHTFREWQKKFPSLGPDYLMAKGTLRQKTGRMFLFSGNLDLAIEFLHVASFYHTSVPFYREVAFEWAKDFYFLGEAYRRQGNFSYAVQFFAQAEHLALLLRSPEIHWVDAGLARTYADMGDSNKAVAYYMNGLKKLESIQGQQGSEEIKIGVFEGALYAYRGLVTLLLKLYKDNGDKEALREAFKYNERLRARAFLDMLGRSRLTRLGGDPGSVAEKEEKIRHQIARIHRQLRVPHLDKAEETRLLDRLESLRKSWHAQQKQAAQQSDRYAQVVFPRPVTVEEVQSVLDPESVLLEYFLHTKTSTLWAITKDHVQAYTLPGPEKLAVLMQYFKTLREPLMGGDEVSQHLAIGRELYGALVRPAERQIRGKKHLIIAPDGPLYYLPFEALIMPDSEDKKDEESESETLANTPYLLKEFRVTYVPSASVFVTQRKKNDAQVTTVRFPLVAFGDPIYREADSIVSSEMQTRLMTHQILRGPSLSRLEFSAREVNNIATIWGIPLDSEHINLRDRATVQRVQEMDLSRYRMLHFATHGVLGDEIGMTTQPALVLSQVDDKDGNDGLLQLTDILDLKLNADLVVLSACNTGLGKLRRGEGIVGLTRAFLYAGASSVVVSLWKVEDQSTSLLMERFYQRLKQGEIKEEALRQAKLDVMRATIELKAIGMRQSLASPFYWASFILVE